MGSGTELSTVGGAAAAVAGGARRRRRRRRGHAPPALVRTRHLLPGAHGGGQAFRGAQVVPRRRSYTARRQPLPLPPPSSVLGTRDEKNNAIFTWCFSVANIIEMSANRKTENNKKKTKQNKTRRSWSERRRVAESFDRNKGKLRERKKKKSRILSYTH